LGQGTGGTIAYNGPYTVHTFTSSGTFVPPKINTAQKKQALIMGKIKPSQ
jgi:hypothetical protein